MHRRLGAAAALLALLGAGALPADAAARPVTGRYTTGVTLPDPSTGGVRADTCDGLPTSRHRRALVLPSAGTLRIVLTSVGDWGVAVRTPAGRALGRADSALAG
ncbi:MAG: hypothetical protein JWO60_1938, partial [Frankiales bacterium]|nr:hypothetical protein [Frankiales bacterium]